MGHNVGLIVVMSFFIVSLLLLLIEKLRGRNVGSTKKTEGENVVEGKGKLLARGDWGFV